MGVYIKHWSLADWKELLKWAKIGANNAMIGEFTEVEELPPHGRLIDADAMTQDLNKSADDCEVWKRHAMEEENDEMVIRADATEITFLEVAMRIKREYPIIIEEDT